jgi:hypothetical protein
MALGLLLLLAVLPAMARTARVVSSTGDSGADTLRNAITNSSSGDAITTPTFTVAPTVSLATAPTSVAAGDLRGSGLTDLVVTESNSGKITVLLSNGSGGFTTAGSYTTGNTANFVALADLDGDGKLDAVVTDTASGTVAVMPGKGDGSFGAAVTYPAIANPIGLTVGNFGGKGKVDLAVLAANGVAVLLNDGAGNFGAPSTIALSHQAQAITTADLLGNGSDDLALANLDGTVSILLGNGTGSFQSLAAFAVAANPLMAIVAANFENSGKLDLAVAQANSNLVSVLRSNGDGTFQSSTDLTVGYNPTALLAVDVNSDGVADLVAVNRGANTFSVLLGIGNGSFGAANDFVVGNTPIAAAAGLFKTGGLTSLAVLNSGDSTISIALGNGDGTFVAARAFKAGLDRKAIASGDLNGDGRSDLVVASYCSISANCTTDGSVVVFLGNADGAYTQSASYALGRSPVAVALGDVNSDGKLDILALNRQDKTLTILSGNGDATFGKAQTYTLSAYPSALYVGDLNGDSKADLAILSDCGQSTCTQVGSLDIWTGDGKGNFTQGASYPTGYSPVSIAGADLRGTGSVDLVVANGCGESSSCSAGTALVFENDGSGKFIAGSETSIGASPAAIALSKLNSSAMNLLVAQSASDTLAVLASDGNSGFGAATQYAVGSSPSALAVADFNGDGLLDVAVVNTGSSTVSLLKGTTSSSTLQTAVSYAVGSGPQALAVVTASKSSVASLVTANGKTTSTTAVSDISSLVHAMSTGANTLGGITPVASNLSTVDAQATLTATLVGIGSQTPTGSVYFYNNDYIWGLPDCGNQPLSESSPGTATASCSTRLLAGGSNQYIYVAYFTGDSYYRSDMFGSSTYTLNKSAPTVSVTPLDNTTGATTRTSAVNDSVTFTAAIVPQGLVDLDYVVGDMVPITGTVTFSQGATALCSNASVSGSWPYQATCTTSALKADISASNITAVFTPSTDAVGIAEYITGSGALTQTVTTAATTVVVNSVSPASPTVDQAITLTATVSPAMGTATVPFAGNIKFLNNGGSIGCDSVAVNTSTGVATCSFGPLTAGAYSHITAHYLAGDTNYNASDSADFSFTVAAAPTTIAVTPSSSTSTVNGSVTFTAKVQSNVTSNASTTWGSWATFSAHSSSDVVTFYDNGTAIPSCTNVQFTSALQPDGTTRTQASATATCAISTLTASGTAHTISATFNGGNTDASYATSTSSSSGNASVTVSAAALTDSLTVSGNPVVGQSVVLTAAYSAGGAISVASASSSAVTFKDGSTTLTCSESSNRLTLNTTTDNGSVTCTTTSLAAGNHSLTAALSGESNYTAPTASASTTIYSSPTKTVVTSSAASPTTDQAVTFYATITPVYNSTNGSFTVATSGTVSFLAVNGTTTTLCSAATVSASGVAQCSTSVLLAGTTQVTATFTGDSSNYGGSTSASFPLAVSAVGTTTTLAATPSSSWTAGQPLVLTATVAASGTSLIGSVPLSGAVTFYDNAVAVSSCTNPVAVAYSSSSWTASCTISSLTITSHGFTATYNVSGGDTNYSLSNSNLLTQSASTAATKTTVSLVSSSTVDTPVLITVTVAPQTGSGSAAFTGTVSITDTVSGAGGAAANCPTASITFNSTTGVATCSATALTAGSHAIGALYTAGTSDNYLTSTVNNTAAINMALANSGLVVTSSSGSSSPTSVVDTSVTFTATIAPSPSSPTVAVSGGKVSFTDNSSAISAACTNASVTTSGMNAIATCTTSALTVASHTISATYSNDANYNNSTGSVGQTVTSATPTITWATPAAIDYGTALSATQLNATANVAGSFNYTPAAGFIPGVGTSTLLVAFTPADAANYSSVSKTVSLTVNAVTTTPVPTIGSLSPAYASVGGAAFTLTVTGTDFASGVTVYWGSTALTTNYVSATQLTAAVTATQIASAGTTAIFVQTAGGSLSNTLLFETDSSTSAAPTFTMATMTVTAGSAATYAVTIPPSVASSSAICLNLPAGTSCSYSSVTKMVTVTTSTATLAGSYLITVVFTEALTTTTTAGILLPILLLPLFWMRRKMKGREAWFTACLGVILFAGSLFAVGCGGGTQSASTITTTQVTSSGVVTLVVK